MLRSAITILGQLYKSIRLSLLILWAKSVLPVTHRFDLEKLGTGYGGWIVPVELLNQSSICWSAGVGEDASFELSLIERFGCQVFSLDPTPRAQAYVASLPEHDPRHHFSALGLWSSDTTVRFYIPDNPAHVSHSIVNLQNTTSYIEVPCRNLPSLMADAGQVSVDLLKIDIEGAEHEVLQSLVASRCLPTILAVEFDQPMPWRKIRKSIRLLLAVGYKIVAIDRWNYTFVRS